MKFFLIGAACLIVTISGVLYIKMRPLEFERNYLSSQIEPEKILIREKSDEIGFFFGASAGEPTHVDNNLYAKVFNSTTPTNALKLGSVIQDLNTMTYDFSESDAYVDIAREAGLRVRGHALVWGKLSDQYKSPDLQVWLDSLPKDANRSERLSNLVSSHIKIMLDRYRGKISQWDVINEPLALFGDGELEENVFLRHLGESYISNAFALAHELDPSLRLFINEQLNNYTGDRAQAFYALVEKLVSEGVPIHGVGLQHHMLFFVESPEATQKYMQKFSKLGLQVEITELDARLRLFKDAGDPYIAQGQYYRDIVDACLKVSACTGVTLWGYNDEDVWHKDMAWLFPEPNEPYLFDEQNRAKPGLSLINARLKL